MEIKYEDYFDDGTDQVFAIDKSDLEYVTRGENIFIKEFYIKDLNNVVDEVKEAFKNETKHKASNNAIVNITAKRNLTLYTQCKILETLRELYDDLDLDIIYGVGIKEDLDYEIKVTYISSKISK